MQVHGLAVYLFYILYHVFDEDTVGRLTAVYTDLHIGVFNGLTLFLVFLPSQSLSLQASEVPLGAIVVSLQRRCVSPTVNCNNHQNNSCLYSELQFAEHFHRHPCLQASHPTNRSYSNVVIMMISS